MSENKFFARIDMNSLGDGRFETSIHKLNSKTNEWENVEWPEGKDLIEVAKDLTEEANGKK